MFDDLSTYYHENVVQAFVEYRDTSKDGLAGRYRDLRSALIAATALFHLREHLPKAGAVTRAEAERICPDYALLGDVVNVSKHKSATQKTPHGAPIVSDANDLDEQLVIIEYEDDAGKYRHVQKTVVVRLPDGSTRNLLEVLTNVVNFWEQHLLSLGVLSVARTFVYDGYARDRPRAECEANRLGFEIVEGRRFRQPVQLLRFNYKTGKAEPIDLTGSKLEFRIYRPQLDIDLSLTHKASGREFKQTITLTEDESAVLSSLSTDAERQAYVHGLPAVQVALRHLAAEAGLVAEDSHDETSQRHE